MKKNYPKAIKKTIDEDQDEDDYKKLFNLFEFTNSPSDFINNDDLKNIFKSSKISFIFKKCKMLLKTKGVIEHRLGHSRGLCGLKVISNL